MTAWVGQPEYEAYLIGMGLLKNPVGQNDLAAFLPWQEALEGAQAEFERRVGWCPFVADSAPSDMVCDAELFQGLDLLRFTGTGAWNITAVHVAGSMFKYGLQVDGSPANVFGYPQNANKRGFPVTILKFFPTYVYPHDSWAGKQRVTVTAQWGRLLYVPASVKLAVMRYAVGTLVPSVTLQRTGGAQKVREGDEEIDYGQNLGLGGAGAGSFYGSSLAAFDREVMNWKAARVG